TTNGFLRCSRYENKVQKTEGHRSPIFLSSNLRWLPASSAVAGGGFNIYGRFPRQNAAYLRPANIPGMDDGNAAGKYRERLRPQQARSIGNRANGSHHAQSD